MAALAEPVLASLSQWPNKGKGGPSSPPSVGGALAAPNPVAGGGGGLLDNLVRLAGLGATVYDKVWGPGRSQDELLQAQRALAMEQKMQLMQERDAKGRQAEFERRVEGVTGQKFGPEVGGAFSKTRDIMTRQANPLLPGYQGPMGEVGPLVGTKINELGHQEPSTEVGPPAEGRPPGPNLVLRPYQDLPGTIGKEANLLRSQAEQATELLPPGQAREQTRQAIVHGPQIALPSEVPKIYKGYSEANLAAMTEEDKARLMGKAKAGDAAMEAFRQSGYKDMRKLVEALTHDTAGPGQLLEMDRKGQEAAIAHFERLQDAGKRLDAALAAGNQAEIERVSREYNQLQIGYSRLTNPLKSPQEIEVMLAPVIKTPGVMYGTTYAKANMVVNLEKAQKYVMGQMDPQNPQDLLDLAGIHLAIQKHPNGFSPEQAKVMKQYIREFPGATPDSIEQASYWIDSNTLGIAKPESHPVGEQAFTPAQQAEMGVDEKGVKQPVPPGTMGPELRQSLKVDPEGRPLPGGEAERQVKGQEKGIPAGATPEQRAIEERWGAKPRLDPYMRKPAPEPSAKEPPPIGVSPGEGAVPPQPQPAPLPLSPKTGPRILDTIPGGSRLRRAFRSKAQAAEDQGRWAPLAIQHANAAGVPPNLVIKMFGIESGWDPQAYNSAEDSVGIGQLRTAAAQDMGLSPEERWDPEKNVKAAVGYLARQLKAFNGNEILAVAAYQMGIGNLKSGKNWGPNTRAYVKAVTGQEVTDEKIAELLSPYGVPYQSRPVARR